MPWSAPFPLLSPRHWHAAVLLEDGQVLLSGGCHERDPPNGSGVPYTFRDSIAAAEVVDPIRRVSRAVRPMRRPRQAHAAARSADGKVIAVAGVRDVRADPEDGGGIQALGSAEVWDPDSDVWSDGAWLVPSRYNPSATQLRDGRLLIAGGGTRHVEGVRCDVGGAAGWRRTGDLHHRRAFHAAVMLSDGRVLVAGGQGPDGAARGHLDHELDSVEIWDPVSETWSVAAPLRLARVQASAVLLADGRVMVLGGRSYTAPHVSTELFDPRTGTWSDTGRTVYARSQPTATVLLDGRVLVVGCSSPEHGALVAELWDPATGEWTCDSDRMAEPRFWHTATALPDGGVLVAGGTWDTDESSRFAQVWRP